MPHSGPVHNVVADDMRVYHVCSLFGALAARLQNPACAAPLQNQLVQPRCRSSLAAPAADPPRAAFRECRVPVLLKCSRIVEFRVASGEDRSGVKL